MKKDTMTKAFLICSLALATLNSAATAQSIDSIPDHNTFTISSTYVNEPRVINVWVPPSYITGSDSLPVLYMPDGGVNEDFPHIANTLAELISSKRIPPIILVGIDNTERRRDLTGPTNNAEDKEIAPVVGGSADFRDFIEKELVAEIDGIYRTCLLYTSDAADERSSVDLGGRRIIKKKKRIDICDPRRNHKQHDKRQKYLSISL